MTGHVHMTPLGGMAGDMFVAGMLDAFPEFSEPVISATGSVLPNRNAQLSQREKSGISARGFDVPEQGETAPIHYPDMDRILADADLPDAARHAARAMLRSLADAESKVHGIPTDYVHFHEIADWDTLADLTAAASVLQQLEGWSWSLDPLPLGGGTVETAHGRLPIPAPATAQLLEGMMVQDDGVSGERVTPTGAAICRYIHDQLTLRPRAMGRLQATGYGAGTRDLPGLPNILVVQVTGGAVQSGDRV
ncbi:MAG: nickel insertion protein, partial [Pseudomonadota bacterium]